MADLEHGPDRMTLSRNETESLCMKAARGAGYSWGMAEEAGFATGWLAAHGIDGATPLLDLLAREPARSRRLGQPMPAPGHWQGRDGSPLCPIHLGAALVDHALLSDGPFSRETQLDLVWSPVLLLPFLVRAAQVSHGQFVVAWQGGRLHITPAAAFSKDAALAVAGFQVLALKITPSLQAGAGASPIMPSARSCISASTLRALDGLALRTTVPATQASRAGAGSSLPDND